VSTVFHYPRTRNCNHIATNCATNLATKLLLHNNKRNSVFLLKKRKCNLIARVRQVCIKKCISSNDSSLLITTNCATNIATNHPRTTKEKRRQRPKMRKHTPLQHTPLQPTVQYPTPPPQPPRLQTSSPIS
jgi:hypothetical protein